MTRLFTFRATSQDEIQNGRELVEVRDQGGTFRSLDQYRAEGWRPIHWQDAGDSDHVRMHVVMEREEET